MGLELGVGAVGSWVGGLATNLMLAKSAKDMIDPMEPATVGDLQKKADKKAEKKRLAFAANKAEKGKTMFTTPMGRGGGNASGSNQPLKQTLG